MPVFLCRWRNGDISIVKAKNKDEAIYYLDEFDNAEESDIFQLREVLIDFRLQDDGTLVLNQFGEGAGDEIMKKAYPELERTLMSDELDALKDDSPEYRAMIHRAVEAERTRLKDKRKKIAEPKTNLGKQIKEVMDAPTTVIDRIIEQTGKEILKKHRPKGPVH